MRLSIDRRMSPDFYRSVKQLCQKPECFIILNFSKFTNFAIFKISKNFKLSTLFASSESRICIYGKMVKSVSRIQIARQKRVNELVEMCLEVQLLVPLLVHFADALDTEIILALTTAVVDVSLDPFTCASGDLTPAERRLGRKAIVAVALARGAW